MPTRTAFVTAWKSLRRALRKLWSSIPRCFKLAASVALIVLVWFAVPSLLVRYGSEASSERGAYGDQYGAVNALFSGLALAGMAYAVILQSKELAEQRMDNRASKKALQDRVKQEDIFATNAVRLEYFNAWFSTEMQGHRTATLSALDKLRNRSFPRHSDLLLQAKFSIGGRFVQGAVEMEEAQGVLGVLSYFERGLVLHRDNALLGEPMVSSEMLCFCDWVVGPLLGAELTHHEPWASTTNFLEGILTLFGQNSE